MVAYNLLFRQIHLDFHTSPDIPGIGAEFDKKQWQDALRMGHVNSITCFAKCHHGWSYHPTKVGKMHPHLDFDLLRAQMDASKEIDVNVPIYISAGLDGVMGVEHPEWREVTIEGAIRRVDIGDQPAGIHHDVLQLGLSRLSLRADSGGRADVPGGQRHVPRHHQPGTVLLQGVHGLYEGARPGREQVRGPAGLRARIAGRVLSGVDGGLPVR